MQTDKKSSLIQLNQQQLSFIEKNGLHLEQSCGVPRISGRIVGLLMVLSRPITIAEICKALHVSHGSVSTNLRLITMMSLAKKVTLTGVRFDYYQFSSQGWVEIIKQKMANAQSLQNLASETIEALEPSGIVKTRFEEMVIWSSIVDQKYNEILEEWRNRNV